MFARLAGGAPHDGDAVEPDADDRIARHIASRPPVDAGVALGAVRLRASQVATRHATHRRRGLRERPGDLCCTLSIRTKNSRRPSALLVKGGSKGFLARFQPQPFEPRHWDSGDLRNMWERRGSDMLMVLLEHWPEYLMEAAELGMFMISACVFATIVASASTLAAALPHAYHTAPSHGHCMV